MNNIIPHHQTEFQIHKGTAINAVKAQGTLALIGAVKDGELINIGTEVFEIDTDQQTGNNHEVIDVSEFAVKAQGTLELTGVVKDGETFTIGEDTFEIDTNNTVQAGNIPIDVAQHAVKAQGTLALTGPVKDGETIFVGGSTVFEIDTDNSVILGNFPIDLSAFAVKAQGTLTVDTQPTVGDTMTIGVGAGSKIYTFVDEADADAEGEIGIGALLANTQENIWSAISGTDGHNTAHTQVTIGGFGDNEAIIYAIKPGTFGNTIATTESFSAPTNTFDADTLGTTVAGADCPAADADGVIISTINAALIDISASQGDGTTVVFTHNTPGTIGNDYGVTVTMANGTFDGETLGTTVLGADCSAANADGLMRTDYNINKTENILAEQGAGTTIVFTHNTPGTIGNAIDLSDTLANGAFDGTTLGTTTAGVDCTAANADGAIIADFNEHTNQGITASQGAGTTVIFESDLAGVIGNAIPSSVDMDNGAFDGETLGTTQLGVNGSIGQALIDDNFLYVADEDNTVHESDWKKIALSDL
jgi:hypothetical protein